ncbi:M42 family metallopeptidase [Thermogladius sp. 4427co]|uniref:M42 family metallopeptidase n=1 Tax=Thermogladius sp. 4427co TaxID=3450718 RepID=UPI003F7A74F2
MVDISRLKEESFRLLEKLTSVHAPSGFESNLHNIVVEELEKSADRIWIDSLGNVIALKKGSRSGASIMLAAHMDEIGLFISYIEDDGFLRVTPIGGVLERTLLHQRVIVLTRTGKVLRGVIGLKPPHVVKPEEAQKIPEMKELFIDIGASSKEEVEKMGVRIGDVAVFDRSIERLAGDRVTGKAFDDRAGLAVMIRAFQLIENNEADVYAVATVQEEVGLKGARTAAYAISPNAALALDVTIASDFPGVAKSEQFTRLGKGPAIKIADGRNASGLITHPEILNFLVKIADEEKIPYQLEIIPGGTTDASIIALNKEGVPSGVISIPARYIHSPTEVVDLNDVAYSIVLTKRFAEKASVEWLSSLKMKIIK